MISAFFNFLYLNMLNIENFSYIGITMLFSEIIDLSWLIIYTDVPKFFIKLKKI